MAAAVLNFSSITTTSIKAQKESNHAPCVVRRVDRGRGVRASKREARLLVYDSNYRNPAHPPETSALPGFWSCILINLTARILERQHPPHHLIFPPCVTVSTLAPENTLRLANATSKQPFCRLESFNSHNNTKTENIIAGLVTPRSCNATLSLGSA